MIKRVTSFILLISIALGTPHSFANSQTEVLPYVSAIDIVNEQHISRYVKCLISLGDKEEASVWGAAKANYALLQYVFQSQKDAIVPLEWLVRVEKDGALAGVIAIDPYDGAFIWGTHHDQGLLNQVFDSEDSKRTKALVKLENDYDLEQKKFVLIGLKNYWVYSNEGEPMDSYLAVSPMDLSRIYQIKDLRPQTFKPLRGDQVALTKQIGRLPHKVWKTSDGSIKVHEGPPDMVICFVDVVPYYRQGATRWCGLFSLAMIHQWWSPTCLGRGYDQAREIAHYLDGKAEDGLSVSEAISVMNNWKEVNNSYADWGTVYDNWYMKKFQKGISSYDLNDPKAWIDWESPVMALVASSGSGDPDELDHWVIITGYNDVTETVYINDPSGVCGLGYYEVPVDYNRFNDDFWTAMRVGAAGIPSDLEPISTTANYSQLPADGVGSIECQLEMAISEDDSSSIYSSGAHIRTVSTDGVSGDGSIVVDSLGDFNHWTGYQGRDAERVCDSSSDPTGRAKIFELYIAGAPKDSTLRVPFILVTDKDITVYYRSWTADEDRTHYHPGGIPPEVGEISIYDDRQYIDSRRNMTKPLVKYNRDEDDHIWRSNYLDYEVHSKLIDEDTMPPSIDSYGGEGSILDSDATDYILWVKGIDASGWNINVEYRFDSESPILVDNADSTLSGWSTYLRCHIPRATWIGRVRKTIYWKFEAVDLDSDRSGDAESTGWSDWIEAGYIGDDDSSGPSAIDPWPNGISLQAGISTTFSIGLSDPSGIYKDGYPVFYGRWDNSNVDDSHYDIRKVATATLSGRYQALIELPEEKAGSTLYWRCLAYDNDDDRENDRAASWSPVLGTYWVQVASLPTISVTPSSRDFGSVQVGSYADLTFTVENTGGGTLTGNASVASPFHIVSGSSYSLTAGQTQTVTVRFSPTEAQLYSEIVTFTGGGEATRAVTGTGNSPQETDPPYPNEIESTTPISPTQMNIVSRQANDTSPPVWYEIDGQFWDVSSWVDGDGGVSDYDYSTARPNPWSDSELLPNRLYQYRQRVKDSADPCNQSSWSDWSEKYTLANIPSAQTISNPTTTTLDVYVNPNSNPPNTEFAIQCTSTSPYDPNWSNKWVDGSGNHSDSEVWQTAAVGTGQTTGGSAPSLIQDSSDKYWVAFSYSGDIYISNSLDAITWSSPINISNVGNASSSSLIQGSDGVYRLAFGAGSAEPYKIYVISSSDGLSWSSPVQVTTGSTSFEPCVIQDSNRRYWIAYNSYSGIYVTSSDDFVNWGSPTRIVSGFMAGSSLIQDAAGKYWIAYYYHGGDWGVYITGSPDGTSWDSPMEIVSGQDDGYYGTRNPELIQDSAGSYWIIYGTVDQWDKHDVALISSSDGENWSSPTTVAGGDSDDGYTSSIIQDESGIYWVVFPSDRSGDRDLWITGSEAFDGTGSYPYLLWQTGSNKTIQGLMPNTTYSFRVKARNGDGVETSLGPAVSGTTGAPIGDFCGANFGPPDGYVDVWDLMLFADHWHSRTGDSKWDPKFDLTGPNFGNLDGYVDVWDLMVFADHWHEGQKA